jgi:hypothetical protein
MLFVSVLILALMGAMGIAALDAAGDDRTAAGFYNRSQCAFYAAEAGLAEARFAIRDLDARSATPTGFPTDLAPTALGDTALYDKEGGQLPVYYGDPDFAPDPIRHEAETGAILNEGTNILPRGQRPTVTLWQLNVAGRCPNGSVSRLEMMATKVLYSGYQ